MGISTDQTVQLFVQTIQAISSVLLFRLDDSFTHVCFSILFWNVKHDDACQNMRCPRNLGIAVPPDVQTARAAPAGAKVLDIFGRGNVACTGCQNHHAVCLCVCVNPESKGL